jgi:hypothetical protein
MPIAINGTGTITGLSGGGLPDGSIHTADIADSAITTAKIAAGAVIPADLAQPLTQATAVPFNSTASIIFTGIPSWAKKISVLFDRVTLSGTNHYLIRLGTASGFESSGYKAQTTIANSGLATAPSTSGFVIWNSVATVQTSGMITIANVSSNNWIASGVTSWIDNTASVVMSAGSKTLSTGVLDRIQILSGNGADTFTGGTLNLIYEG